MDKYIISSSVNIFPSSLRSGEYSSGKFTTEKNLTNFLKAVTDKESFSIADPNVIETNPHYNSSFYLFVINGFCFKVERDPIDDLMTGLDHLWVSIRLDANDRLISWKGGTNLDDTDGCTALYFSSNKPEKTSELNCYSLDLKDENRFAKFNTDTFFDVYDELTGTKVNLTTALKDKQNKFTNANKFNLSAGLVDGVLPSANGGTGKATLEEAVVGKATKLVDSIEGSATSVGAYGRPVYFSEGVPVEMAVVNNSEKLNVGTIGTSTEPVYFKDGKPIKIGEKIDAYGKGLQEKVGSYEVGVDTQSRAKIDYTSVYFDKEKEENQVTIAKDGITIHISANTPTGTPGKPGDLWFKYSEN